MNDFWKGMTTTAFGALLGNKKQKQPDNSAYYNLYNPLSEFLRSRIGTAMPKYTPEQGSVGYYGTEAYKRALQGLPQENFGETFRTLYQQPATKIFKEETIPGVQKAYQGAGTYWGSERAGAEQKSQMDFVDLLNQSRERLGQSQIAQMLQSAPGAMQWGLEEFQRSLPEYNPVIQLAMQLLGQSPYNMPGDEQPSWLSYLLDILKEYYARQVDKTPAPPMKWDENYWKQMYG